MENFTDEEKKVLEVILSAAYTLFDNIKVYDSEPYINNNVIYDIANKLGLNI